MSRAKADPNSNDDSRWKAVMSRDAAADGTFYYSVRTTGVYCRPSCAARRPRRENVGFHASCAAAERAGFRPCKRCRPKDASLADRRAMAIAQACRLIEEAAEMPEMDDLAATVGMSRFHFQRVFKAVTGLTPKAYANGQRGRRVRNELAGSRSVTAAIHGAGFNSGGRFYANSPALLGMTPTSFRAGGKNVSIRFAVGECSLGSILVAATSRGVCAILLGDEPGALVRDLQDRFAKAELIGGDQDFEQLVAQVVGFVERQPWASTCRSMCGERPFSSESGSAVRYSLRRTASYTEIAQRIGSPQAVRAVGRACASNPIAVAIPCHRVVRTDGCLSGYRWGIERKAKLLDREVRSTELQDLDCRFLAAARSGRLLSSHSGRCRGRGVRFNRWNSSCRRSNSAFGQVFQRDQTVAGSRPQPAVARPISGAALLASRFWVF